MQTLRIDALLPRQQTLLQFWLIQFQQLRVLYQPEICLNRNRVLRSPTTHLLLYHRLISYAHRHHHYLQRLIHYHTWTISKSIVCNVYGEQWL